MLTSSVQGDCDRSRPQLRQAVAGMGRQSFYMAMGQPQSGRKLPASSTAFDVKRSKGVHLALPRPAHESGASSRAVYTSSMSGLWRILTARYFVDEALTPDGLETLRLHQNASAKKFARKRRPASGRCISTRCASALPDCRGTKWLAQNRRRPRRPSLTTARDVCPAPSTRPLRFKAGFQAFTISGRLRAEKP